MDTVFMKKEASVEELVLYLCQFVFPLVIALALSIPRIRDYWKKKTQLANYETRPKVYEKVEKIEDEYSIPPRAPTPVSWEKLIKKPLRYPFSQENND